MHHRGKWITKKRRWGLLLFGFFFLAGCSSQLEQYFPWWYHNTGKELQERLDEGGRFFKAGDYSAAAAVFQNLKETGHPDVIRPALYGLACSRFMLADSKQEYLEAVEILELWQRISPSSLEQEDPRMLLSLFAEGELPWDSKGEADDRQDSKEHFLLWFFSCKERIDALEDQISGLEKEITEYEKQKSAMKEMEAANRAMKEALKEKEDASRTMVEELSKLRDQIRTFETIDQEIQEKKKGISSP